MRNLLEKEPDDFLHNFGEENPIPIGAVALCGAVSTRKGPGEVEPLVRECCPICVAFNGGQMICHSH